MMVSIARSYSADIRRTLDSGLRIEIRVPWASVLTPLSVDDILRGSANREARRQACFAASQAVLTNTPVTRLAGAFVFRLSGSD
jgi:hypothetical protein